MPKSESPKENKQNKSNLNKDKQSEKIQKEKSKKIKKAKGDKENIYKEKYENNSYNIEKNELSKGSFLFAVSSNYYKCKIKREKFFNYSKDGKNIKEKNNIYDHLEEYKSHEKDNKINYKTKNNEFNKNEIYDNEANKYSEDIKNNKKLKLKENDMIINKCKLYRNDYIDTFIEKKNILENKKIKTKEKKYKIKFNIIYIIYFYYIILGIIFFSQFIKCYNRKIKLASTYINLKVIGKGRTKIYEGAYAGIRPNFVILNNIINLTENSYYINFDDSENNINNITLIWNTPPRSTRYLFNDCSNIIAIDLSYFDTSQVNNMESMFIGCSNLISLNLSNLNTSSVTTMEYMFYECSNLTSLDLSYFDTSRVNNMNQMFYECSNLISLNLSNIDASSVTSMQSMFGHCTNLEYINLINTKINRNIKSFLTPSNYEEKLSICTENDIWPWIFSLVYSQYVNCINNIPYFNNNDNEPIIKCYKKNIDTDNPCKMCGNNYFNNSGIVGNLYVNCYINDISYQVPIDTSIINTSENLINAINMTNYSNSILAEESEKYTVLINQLSTSDKSSFYASIIIEKEIEIKNKTKLIENIINKLNISHFYLENAEAQINNISIILTSTKNQEKNENENMITINLCKCENILKNKYNISTNEPLYILLIILEIEKGMKIPKIEYEIYSPFYNDNTLTKLDLNLCKGTKINLLIPVTINDILDKYNPKSGYYNDICYKTTSEYETDISIKERRNEFIENNMTLCEENCDLINYNYTNEKVKCSCDVKTSVKYDYKFNKNEFFKNFIDIKNIANINIIKCYKIVLNSKNLVNNYGFYIIGSIMILYIITIFIFIFISYKRIKYNLYIISILSDKINQIKKEPDIKDNENSMDKIIKKSKGKRRRKKKRKNNKINKDNIINIKNDNKIKFSNNIKETILDNKDKLFSKQNLKNILKIKSLDKNIEYIKDILESKDFEINSLEYEEAFKLDKRTYFQYYISLLKYNHPIMFSFGPYNDYNSRIIKIFLFFFSFSSDLTINALFFNDDTMHKIYKDRGKFDLLFQIPQILYSTLISKLIDSLIKNLALSQDYMIQLKQEKEKCGLNEKYTKILKVFRIKIICFFVCSFIILMSFWYYITCFCGIYANTQIHLIKDCIISLITSLVYPFGISLIPDLFRISGIRMKKPYLYKFSSFLENYLV